MKKLILIQLISLAACTSALAQNVTMYGILDQAVEHLNKVGPSGSSLTRMPGLTGTLPSRLGVRGTEDLGGGLRAVFTLEQGFGVDSGTLNQGGRMWGRQSFVGLGNEWGTLSFGRQYSMLYLSQLDADILGPNLYGSSSLDNYLPNARFDNSVAYRGMFAGWTIGGSYSFGRDAVNAGPSPSGTNCAGESATDKQACKAWSAMVKYDTKEWGGVLAVDEMKGGPGAFAGLTSSSLKDRRIHAAGWARFDALKVGAGVFSRKNDASVATPKSNLWYLSAAYAFTPLFTVDAGIFQLKYRDSANQSTLGAVRATYALSKRTALYATAGHVSNDGTLANSVSSAAAGGAPVAGGSQTGMAAGVRHSF